MKSKKVSDNTMTYKDVIEDFKNKCNSCCLSDDWLHSEQEKYRKLRDET